MITCRSPWFSPPASPLHLPLPVAVCIVCVCVFECGKYEIYSFMMTAECATANAFYGFWVQLNFTSQHSQQAEERTSRRICPRWNLPLSAPFFVAHPSLPPSGINKIIQLGSFARLHVYFRLLGRHCHCRCRCRCRLLLQHPPPWHPLSVSKNKPPF